MASVAVCLADCLPSLRPTVWFGEAARENGGAELGFGFCGRAYYAVGD